MYLFGLLKTRSDVFVGSLILFFCSTRIFKIREGVKAFRSPNCDSCFAIPFPFENRKSKFR